MFIDFLYIATLIKCASYQESNSLLDPLITVHEHLGPNTELNMSGNGGDFNYNDLSMTELSSMKLPYINSNRNIFANLDINMIDLFLSKDNYLLEMFYNNFDNIIMKILAVADGISCILEIKDKQDTELDEEEVSHLLKHSLNIGFDLGNKVCLIEEDLLKLYKMLVLGKTQQVPNKNVFYKFIKNIDDFVFEGMGFSLFHTQMKNRTFLNTMYKDILNDDDVTQVLNSINNTYLLVGIVFQELREYFLKIGKWSFPFLGYTSFILKSNILVKFTIEVKKMKIFSDIYGLDNSLSPSQMNIYSINGDDLVDKLSKIIKIIINEKLVGTLNKFGIRKITIPTYMFSRAGFDTYEITIISKIYLIKVFDINNHDELPSGISTAYLNVKAMFESLGYLDFKKLDENNNKYFFISVEEKTDTYISTDNLVIFNEHSQQILNFILDLLHILDIMYMYRIKLIGNRILFAVDVSTTRWRFRADDIGTFIYVETKNVYENLDILIGVINKLIIVAKDPSMKKYLKNLKKIAKKQNIVLNALKNQKIFNIFKIHNIPYDTNYFKTLIDNVHQKIKSN